MSALGQKQTYAVQKVMSALPPKAYGCTALANVCFGPRADIEALFNNLVGAGQQGGRDGNIYRASRTKIYS
jgi:hypothetical protein